MLILQNKLGITKKAPVGFSWTVFFFGFFVPLFRGDWKWTLIMAATSLIAGAVTYGIGAWIILFIFAFKYNEWYLNDLKSQGYEII